MRQIVLSEPGEFREEQAAAPAPQPGEALVRIHRVGVCGTDLHAFAGRQPFFSYPRILGHELGVEVVEAPANDRGIRAGDRCAVEPYVNCGACHACRLGRPNCCERIRVLGVHTDGGMRPFLNVPVRLLYKSERLSLDQLALVETLGIGAHAVRRAGLRAGEDALVIGAGPIGLAVLQFAKAAGANVRVLERSESRRNFAAQFGVEAIAEPGDRLADAVFDATGNAAAMEASFERVAHAGRLVFVGLVQGRLSFEDPLFHRREMTLFASRNSLGEFPRIIQMIEEGRIDTSPWITDRLRLREVPATFSGLTQRPNLVKAVIEVEDSDA
ncbi:MAG: zinc-binding alcohol dehydrogenase family protein [Bryobacteraceae bacterium]